MSKIGVVMANYKMPLIYIQQAVISVAAQNMTDWRLYIEGVKGDEILEQVEKFVCTDSRITFEYLEKPYVYEQRNAGLKKAVQECKYVTMLDSDDFLLPNKLLIELMRAELDDTDLVYSAYYYTDPDLSIFRYSGTPVPASKMGLLEGCVVPDYALLSSNFAKEHLMVTEEDGWTGLLNWPRYKTGCVYDLWLRAIEHNARIGLHAAPTWLYRQRENSLGKQLGPTELLDRKIAIDDAKRRWGIKTPTNISVKKLWEAGDPAAY